MKIYSFQTLKHFEETEGLNKAPSVCLSVYRLVSRSVSWLVNRSVGVCLSVCLSVSQSFCQLVVFFFQETGVKL